VRPEAAPGGKEAEAAAWLEVQPVMDLETKPGVVALVRPTKAGPVLLAAAG